MDNPGVVPLTFAGVGALSLVGPGTFIGDWACDLDGMLSATIQANFAYGAGGVSCAVYVQTSLDGGQTPIDIAAFGFTTTSGIEIVNLSALDKVSTSISPAQQTLELGTVIDGVLGDRLRFVAVVSGTYGASSGLNVTAVVR